MSPTKPLDVVILMKNQDHSTEDSWEPYQEYGERAKGSPNDWSCFILTKEGEQFAVRCTNTTKKLLTVRISVDACYVQQYLLRPKGEVGDTVTCHGTGWHCMMFNLVSALTRAGNKHSRTPFETGCINVTAYQPSGAGNGLPPPEKPTEQLGLPVNMDGTLWKLCVRLTGSEMMIGEPSPHAAEISKVGWRQFGSLSFNYRTKDELQSGRIRGIEIPQKQVSPFDMSTVSSVGKRRREMTSDGTSPSRKRRDRPSADTIWKAHPSATKDNSSSPNASNHLENSEDTIRVVRFSPLKKLRKTPSFECSPVPEFEPTVITLSSPLTSWTPNSLQVNSDASGNSLRKSASRPSMESSLSNSSAAHSTEPATYVVSPAANPAELILLPSSPPSQSSPQPQPRHSAVIPTITSPSTPLHDSPEPEQSVAASINEADRVVIALTTFLDEVSPFRPLGLSTKDLQEAGISTLAELRIIAHKPEVFRTKISVLADLCERDRYLWMMFRKGLKKLLGEDHREQSAGDPIHETDPVGKFVRSLGGGGCIESEALVSGLRGAGISSEKDLLVLSRNLDKYTENIPFLREFATTKKFGWMVFQVGLEGLPGQKVSTSIQTQDHGASGEGHAFVKWFLDTIDPDKPLGHLADSFVEQGLNDRVPLLHVAEDIEIAVDCIPFLQDLASGDQLIWAMILVGLENLTKSV